MTRAQLEHIIRAAGEIAADREIIVIGSQSVLAQFPNAPAELLVSEEADVFPKNAPDKAIEIDGAIGERSLFHQTHAIYAHGVSEETATLPRVGANGSSQSSMPIQTESQVGVWKSTTWLSASSLRGAKRTGNSCERWRATKW